MDQDLQVSREQASQDIEQIKRLREFAPFHSYFIRRLRMKRDAIEERFRTEPAAKCSHEEREILRRLLHEYDTAILNMLETDERSSRLLLENNPLPRRN
jgi:succinate dehydrogenase flavin-adding protein (antitoxin of CptAB toxin-antitoxin module)